MEDLLEPVRTRRGASNGGAAVNRPRRSQGSPARRQLTAAHESSDGAHQFVGELFWLTVGTPTDDAIPRMVVEEPQRDLVERGLYRGNLGEHVDAVAVLVDHPLNAADLSLDAAQALVELVLRGGVAAGGWCRWPCR